MRKGECARSLPAPLTFDTFMPIKNPSSAELFLPSSLHSKTQISTTSSDNILAPSTYFEIATIKPTQHAPSEFPLQSWNTRIHPISRGSLLFSNPFDLAATAVDPSFHSSPQQSWGCVGPLMLESIARSEWGNRVDGCYDVPHWLCDVSSSFRFIHTFTARTTLSL